MQRPGSYEKTDIPYEDWGVHETHCCLKHGCKYGENDKCPVVLNLITQKYGCQIGFVVNQNCMDWDPKWKKIETQNHNPVK